jgi:biopolymer transport protein ExbD
MRRMSRNRKTITKMNLTSLMDVFTILVFFLLVNSASNEVLQTPKQIALPASVVEDKPRETVVIVVSPEEVTIGGELVARVEDILATDARNIPAMGERLAQLSRNVIGVSTKAMVDSREVTILVDKRVPFRVVKKVMSTCTSQGYERISLAVLQKAPNGAATEV